MTKRSGFPGACQVLRPNRLTQGRWGLTVLSGTEVSYSTETSRRGLEWSLPSLRLGRHTPIVSSMRATQAEEVTFIGEQDQQDRKRYECLSKGAIQW